MFVTVETHSIESVLGSIVSNQLRAETAGCGSCPRGKWGHPGDSALEPGTGRSWLIGVALACLLQWACSSLQCIGTFSLSTQKRRHSIVRMRQEGHTRARYGMSPQIEIYHPLEPSIIPPVLTRSVCASHIEWKCPVGPADCTRRPHPPSTMTVGVCVWVLCGVDGPQPDTNSPRLTRTFGTEPHTTIDVRVAL